MPYPLPEKPWTGTLDYFLVAVPSDTAFRRAAIDAIDQLGRRWNWGEEGPTADSDDAAQVWLEAMHETWRLYEMGWPDDVLAAIDELEPKLDQLINKPCCPGDSAYVQYLPPELDPNRDTVLDDSATGDYGSTPVSGTAERLQYKCEAIYLVIAAAANVFALLGNYEGYQSPLQPSSVAAALGKVPGIGGLVKAAWELVDALLDLAWNDFTGLEAAADAINADAARIACQVYNADGAAAVAQALETEITSTLNAAGLVTGQLIAPYLPYLTYANIVYEGEYTDIDGNLVDVSSYLTPGTHDCTDCPPVVSGWQIATADILGVGGSSTISAWDENWATVQQTGTNGFCHVILERTADIINGNHTLRGVYIDFEPSLGSWSNLEQFVRTNADYSNNGSIHPNANLNIMPNQSHGALTRILMYSNAPTAQPNVPTEFLNYADELDNGGVSQNNSSPYRKPDGYDHQTWVTDQAYTVRFRWLIYEGNE